MSKRDISGLTVVITGASSGIGAATARRLATDGFHVVAAARRRDRVARALQVPVDNVVDEAQVTGVAERLDIPLYRHPFDNCVSAVGKLNIALNEATTHRHRGVVGGLDIAVDLRVVRNE